MCVCVFCLFLPTAAAKTDGGIKKPLAESNRFVKNGQFFTDVEHFSDSFSVMWHVGRFFPIVPNQQPPKILHLLAQEELIPEAGNVVGQSLGNVINYTHALCARPL